MLSCEACLDSFQMTSGKTLHRDHFYCADCMEELVRQALENSYPHRPQCCAPVRLAEVRGLMSKQTVPKLEAMRIELATVMRVYCHRQECNNFIAPHSIHHGQAFCQRCNRTTCATCRHCWHFGPCGSQPDIVVFYSQARRLGLQRCPHCRHFVEKSEGCKQMRCVQTMPLVPTSGLLLTGRCRCLCGAEFCYVCGWFLHVCVCEEDPAAE